MNPVVRPPINLGLEELQQLTREIQDSVMAIRAQPVKPVFQRMGRIVREIADMTGKQVRLVTEGENTEVDKTVIDKLAEPLTHMIRNAVDHGLETPEKRTEAGKSAEGVLRLSAKHRSGRIVIEIADDGAGINRERVKRNKAIENGLITPETNLSDEEIDNLIFHPGFSTADKLSDISGRGVGMDVVKRSIQLLEAGSRSPPSRAGLCLHHEPAAHAGRPRRNGGLGRQPDTGGAVDSDCRDAATGEGRHSLLRMRASGLSPSATPSVRWSMSAHPQLPGRPGQSVEGVALLVESEGGGQRALMVDAIQGQRQVVIKSLEANYTNVPGYRCGDHSRRRARGL
jgi:two-component system chemotaxis sensor kinase CheA